MRVFVRFRTAGKNPPFFLTELTEFSKLTDFVNYENSVNSVTTGRNTVTTGVSRHCGLDRA
jgi:hypothetical protein